MTLTISKYFPKDSVWVMRILKIMNAIKVSRCCCFFTLRQGTILIAVMELTITSFMLFLLLLGATHTQDILAMASIDLQQLEENNWSEGNIEQSSIYFTNNEMRMLDGQLLATITMILIYSGLILISIHFICCLLLLYGAIRNSPNFVLPWSSSVLLSIISGCFSLFVLSFLPDTQCKIVLYAAAIFFLGLETYSWLIVFSYYRELKS